MDVVLKIPKQDMTTHPPLGRTEIYGHKLPSPNGTNIAIWGEEDWKFPTYRIAPLLWVCSPTWCQEVKRSSDGERPGLLASGEAGSEPFTYRLCLWETHHFNRLMLITVDFI